MHKDYLNGTPYTLNQPDDLYHFNSDSELLGRFLKIKKQQDILDIGCGTGALLHYAAMFHPKRLVGIDLFEEVILACQDNLQSNHIQAETYVCPLQQFMANKFDVIICNPPFFKSADHLRNANQWIQAARHQVYLTYPELLTHVDRLLKKDGRFYVVIPSCDLDEVMGQAIRVGLHLARMQVLYQNATGEAKRVLLEWKYRSRSTIVEPAIDLSLKRKRVQS